MMSPNCSHMCKAGPDKRTQCLKPTPATSCVALAPRFCHAGENRKFHQKQHSSIRTGNITLNHPRALPVEHSIPSSVTEVCAAHVLPGATHAYRGAGGFASCSDTWQPA